MSLQLPSGFVPGSLPNCGVVAMTIVTGAPYADVWAWFRKRGKHGPRWQGVTWSKDLAPCAKAFGIRLKKLPLRGRGHLSPPKWSDLYSLTGRIYVLRTGYHFGVLQDGIYLDNGAVGRPVSVELSRVARKRVTDVWLVLKKGERA